MNDSREDRNRDERVTECDLPPLLAKDRFYRALTAIERRRLLYYLLEETESTVEELATVLSGWEATTTGTMRTPADRSELRLTLIHNHLPRLAEADLIRYEPQEGTVQLPSMHSKTAEIIRQSVEAEPRTEQ